MQGKWHQYATEDNDFTGVFRFNSCDEITVQRDTVKESSGHCYWTWNNTWLVIHCTKPMTDEVIDELEAAGMFPCGQVSHAVLLHDGKIRYWGECDSGD